MPWKTACLLLAFPILLSFQQPHPIAQRVEQAYKEADRLFNLPDADSAALKAFTLVIPQLKKLPSSPHIQDLLFQSYFKKAIESEVRSDDIGAKEAYLSAFRYPSADSLICQLNIYTGCIYYKLNNFDSANYFLLTAERLIRPDNSAADKIRLYNTLGVLYYDNGNYLQGRNYFNQALQILKATKNPDKATAASLQTNIATAYFRLGMYQASLDMYRRGLKYHLFGDQIRINIGRSNAELKNYDAAMAAFRQVNAHKLSGVLNEMASVKLKQQQPDSALFFLDQFQHQTGNRMSPDAGFNANVRADLQLSQGEELNAIKSLQRAINIFSGNFSDPDVYTNPMSFGGTFTYHGLFDALSKKAMAWETRYRKNGNPSDLVAAMAAYDATLKLLAYIERSYDMDDAKLLFKEKSGHLFEQALNVCLQLDHLFPDSNYLQRAFIISEKSKASVISSNLRQRSFSPATREERDLLQQERNIKYNIARLNGRSEQAGSDFVSTGIGKDKAQYEIELTRIQKELERSSRYYRLKYDDDHPGVDLLQSRLGKRQALISFSYVQDSMHVFVITDNSFKYLKLEHADLLARDVNEWIRQLRADQNGRNFNGGDAGLRLYTHLVRPIQNLTRGKDQWTIIPDGIFYMLPFESLPADNNGKTLLETNAISYQFSAAFMIRNAENEKPDAQMETLAFAPFADAGADFHEAGLGVLARLPASATEIDGLKGLRLIGKEATKKAFLDDLNKYPVIHLATHAVSDISDPAASFVAFYPASGKPADDCLFLDELYGLSMDSCKLMIISACETGNGQMIKQEGIMSLSRAFMYAGCPSTVNSLWKADDDATASILKKFHEELETGMTKSAALQQAKLDYIRKNPLHRNPAYWSHLILTGDDSALYQKKTPWYRGLLLLICLGGVVFSVYSLYRRS